MGIYIDAPTNAAAIMPATTKVKVNDMNSEGSPAIHPSPHPGQGRGAAKDAGERRGESELKEVKRQNEWMVYLLRCADGSLYCGITNDLEKRLAAHREGRGAKYTRSRLPVELAGASPPMDRSAALKLEHRIKQLPPGRKIAVLSKRP